MESCQESYSECLAKALSDSDMVIAHAEYEYSRQVIDEASASGAGGPINYLRDVINIKESHRKNSDSEKDLLDSSLLGLSEGKYQQSVTGGVSKEYTAAISSGSGAASAENALNAQLDTVEAYRTELEFLIDA